MDTIKKQTKRWWPAVFAAGRYITYNALLAYHSWHIAMKDQWSALTDWDRINVGCSIGLSVLVAIGAVMNGSWTKAAGDQPK